MTALRPRSIVLVANTHLVEEEAVGPVQHAPSSRLTFPHLSAGQCGSVAISVAGSVAGTTNTLMDTVAETITGAVSAHVLR